MKRILLLTLAPILFTGCGEGTIFSRAKATPTPSAKSTPAPTPKPGDWMFKDYKNPLEKRPGQ